MSQPEPGPAPDVPIRFLNEADFQLALARVQLIEALARGNAIANLDEMLPALREYRIILAVEELRKDLEEW